jgi:K(+)-stimulated pyrophosphate-energized sodium pump
MAIGKQKKFGNILKKRKKISLIILLSVMLILLVSYGVIFASPEDETNSTNETVSENETTQAGESENLFPAFFVAPIASLITLIFAVILAFGVLKKDEGTDKMKEISKAIREGADAYLFRQYKVIAIFVVIVFVVLLILSFVVKDLFNIAQPFAYLTGVFYSALAGFIGMKIATRANSRTAWAAKSSLNKGLRVAFNAGTIMGMCVVGLGLFDLSFWYIIGKFVIGFDNLELTQTMLTIGMGASSMALFARVGGGIFTKAADVGADLVGKVEAGIPEDDPRNPAAIADNVGDNVGDVAGMGADLYESYIGSILATMALGFAAFKGFTPINFVEGFGNGTVAMILPMIVAGMGMIFSILGTFLVRAKKADAKSLLRAIMINTVEV